MSSIHNIPTSFQPEKHCLAQKNIVITGAASELGASISLACAKAGATVLLLDRLHRELNVVYDQICKAGYAEPVSIEFDLAKAEQPSFDQLKQSLTENFPHIDGLVHLANWGAPLQPIAHSSIDTWKTILDHQLIKPMALTRALLPMLIQSNKSSIVFTSWQAGRTGRAYWGATGAAFAGIENLAETLSHELNQHNIAISTFNPGNVRTAIRKQFYPAENPLSLIDPAAPHITNSYLYLLSQVPNEISGKRFTRPAND